MDEVPARQLESRQRKHVELGVWCWGLPSCLTKMRTSPACWTPDLHQGDPETSQQTHNRTREYPIAPSGDSSMVGSLRAIKAGRMYSLEVDRIVEYPLATSPLYQQEARNEKLGAPQSHLDRGNFPGFECNAFCTAKPEYCQFLASPSPLHRAIDGILPNSQRSTEGWNSGLRH